MIESYAIDLCIDVAFVRCTLVAYLTRILAKKINHTLNIKWRPHKSSQDFRITSSTVAICRCCLSSNCQCVRLDRPQSDESRPSRPRRVFLVPVVDAESPSASAASLRRRIAWSAGTGSDKSSTGSSSSSPRRAGSVTASSNNRAMSSGRCWWVNRTGSCAKWTAASDLRVGAIHARPSRKLQLKKPTA